MSASDLATSLVARLDRAEARLSALAATAPPAGLTDPDPGGEERWDAGQVWAHIAEFVPYWTDQARLVVAGRGAEPVPYGRLRTNASRVDGIEAGRHRPADERWAGIRAALAELRVFALGLSADDWQARGQHALGDVHTVASFLTARVADHLDEHVAQLERLAGR